ncbi:uncharacterized protein LOC134292247 [Aedes albopictus]|uniref:Uncharacterized protein n=1 Tax=Aedes albopictus TaxID=7160 RepID=A0ABM1Y2W7_AEDAL
MRTILNEHATITKHRYVFATNDYYPDTADEGFSPGEVSLSICPAEAYLTAALGKKSLLVEQIDLALHYRRLTQRNEFNLILLLPTIQMHTPIRQSSPPNYVVNTDSPERPIHHKVQVSENHDQNNNTVRSMGSLTTSIVLSSCFADIRIPILSPQISETGNEFKIDKRWDSIRY